MPFASGNAAGVATMKLCTEDEEEVFDDTLKLSPIRRHRRHRRRRRFRRSRITGTHRVTVTVTVTVAPCIASIQRHRGNRATTRLVPVGTLVTLNPHSF